MLRLLISGMFDRPYYLAVFENSNAYFYKPLIKFSIINLVTTLLPILIADILCFITVAWGYQLLITCIESFIIILILIVL